MRKVIMIAIVLIATINTKAQEKIKGKVLELSKNGNALPIFGANVYWEGTSIGTTTDSKGRYSINEATSFPATLSVSYVGYTLDSKEIVDDRYIFYLKSIVELDEVQVKGKVNTTEISTINTLNIQTLNTGELQKAACCNLSECFETNNTVDVVYSDGLSGIKKIQMLGLDGSYVQITNENMPLIRGLLRSYGLSYVPGTWIEGIQIIKGMGSVINGFESLTGQINLEYFKPASADKLYWNIYTNSEGKLENNLLLAKKKGNWKSNLFTHVSYLNREIDHHGSFHDHSTNTDVSGGDGFLDVPKVKQFSLLNRWQYFGSDDYRGQIVMRALVEDRLAGQKEEIINPYIVDIHNDLLQLSTKLGTLSENSIGLQTSFTLHNQRVQFGENTYNALQESVFLALIKEKNRNENNILKYGLSYYADRLTETFEGKTNSSFNSRKRVDLITGFFSEYQYKTDKFNFIMGLRTDYYNIADKLYYSPRLNMKYNPGDRTAIRFTAGRGFRISNSLIENIHYLGSSRKVIIADNLNPEEAVNYGLNMSHCFYLFNRESTLNIDMYRTVFSSQIIVDIEDQDIFSIYNLDGASYSNSMQIDLDYQIFDGFQTRIGYKLNNTISNFNGVDKSVPLVPYSRGLINLSYETNSKKWMFDITANYVGVSRIPKHDELQDESSEPFYLFNANINRKWDKFELYIGGENLSNYTQADPIINAEDPNSDDFDASLVWGPIMGRLIYAGIRCKVR